MDNNNVVIEFNPICCYDKDKHLRTILLKGTLKNGLYQVTLSSASRPSNSSSGSIISCCSKSLTNSGSFSTSSPVVNSCNTTSITSCPSCNKNSLVNLWHNHLGHPNLTVVHKILTSLELHISTPSSSPFCDACKYGKVHHNSFPLSQLKPRNLLKLYTQMYGGLLLILLLSNTSTISHSLMTLLDTCRFVPFMSNLKQQPFFFNSIN